MHISFLQQCMRKKLSSPIFLPYFPAFQTLLHHKPFSSHRIAHASKTKKLYKALRILDLIAPRTTVSVSRQCHLRLIFLETESYQFSKQQIDSDDIVITNVFDEMSKHGVLNQGDVFKRDDLRENASVFSHAVSSCASGRNLFYGVQLHCLAITTGFIINIYVGSSLISLYGKCHQLENAYNVFDEMPVRNVVSWTAIIAGFAQEWQVDVCLGLYRRMRNSISKPNDFTFTSLLSACTGSGALGQGRSAHCQTIQMGFDCYLHIANALISMYSKCGNLEDAFQVFKSIQSKDIISWNSIIAGCSLHGLALQALDLFDGMKQQRLKPDAITFLGVLSSCRHVGLVEQGRLYFNSMLEHGVKPELDHYSCIVDLLGRAGLLEEARELIEKMPVYPNAVIWGSLLSSCRLHGDVWHGIQAAESRLLLEPGCAATHVQLVNLYASAGCWDQAARLRKLMKDSGLKTNPGYSWIEIKNEVFQFRAEDKTNSRVTGILNVVDTLVDHMRSLGYEPEIYEQGFDDGTHG